MLVIGLLMVKHYIFDFPLQSASQLANKGRYANLTGLSHSLLHGLGTALVFLLFSPWFLLLGLIDFLTHYHIDWFKKRFGCQDVTDRRFWNHLGLDQLAHGLNYLLITALFMYLR